MDQQEIARLWREALTEVAQVFLKDAIVGLKPKMYRMSVSIDIPEVLVKAIQEVCKKMEIDSARIFESMATKGFNKSLQEKMKPPDPALEGAQDDVLKQLQALGLDMSGLQGGMSKMKDIMKQVQSMEQEARNAGFFDPTPEDSTDSEQPNLPFRKSPGG
jgi:hypothetical protein